MLLCAAQIKPISGDVSHNIEKHADFIRQAALHQVDFILFPELSLTGYEPGLAEKLATRPDDKRFAVFSELSALHGMTIALGMPIRQQEGIVIGMLVFQPGKEVSLYAKQRLHADEEPFFIPGNSQLIVEIKGEKIAPAICYESLLPEHVEQVSQSGVGIYAASVAKSAGGIEKAYRHYPKIAASHEMTILMSNCIGLCDTAESSSAANFESVGQTAIWNKKEILAGQLDAQTEGMLIFDTLSGQLSVV